MTLPIYIPSKGRPNQCLTAQLLDKESIGFKIVVEPQEVDEYAAVWGQERLISTQEDNCGLGQSRNICKEYSRLRGEAWHWQIDDNCQSLRERIGKKNVVKPARYVLERAEDYVSKFENIGIAGLTHIVFAFARKKAIGINTQCSSVVLINNSLDVWWRRNIVEDTDYSMQVLTFGDRDWCTLNFHRLLFQKPAQNTMKGGMTDKRVAGFRQIQSEALAKAWPGCFRVKKMPDENEGTKYRVMPSRVWSTFTQRPRFTKER